MVGGGRRGGGGGGGRGGRGAIQIHGAKLATTKRAHEDQGPNVNRCGGGRLGGGEGALVGAFFLRLAHRPSRGSALLPWLSRLGLLASSLAWRLSRGSQLGLVLPLDYLVSPCFVSCLQPVGRLGGKLGVPERARRRAIVVPSLARPPSVPLSVIKRRRLLTFVLLLCSSSCHVPYLCSYPPT